MAFMLDKMNRDTIVKIENYLYSTSNDDKIEWSRRIINTRLRMVGGSVPTIKKIAKCICASRLADDFIALRYYDTFEMVLLGGFVIAYSKKNTADMCDAIYSYLANVDNWCAVDNIVSAIKVYDDRYYDFLVMLTSDGSIWRVRYGIVGLMTNYFDTRLDEALDTILHINMPTYYIDMAIAWAISVAYIKGGRDVLPKIKEAKLSSSIVSKAIGKVRDSFRVSDIDKTYFREYFVN